MIFRRFSNNGYRSRRISSPELVFGSENDGGSEGMFHLFLICLELVVFYYSILNLKTECCAVQKNK